MKKKTYPHLAPAMALVVAFVIGYDPAGALATPAEAPDVNCVLVPDTKRPALAFAGGDQPAVTDDLACEMPRPANEPNLVDRVDRNLLAFPGGDQPRTAQEVTTFVSLEADQPRLARIGDAGAAFPAGDQPQPAQ